MQCAAMALAPHYDISLGILSCEKHRLWPASASAFLSVVTVVRLAVKGGWCLCVSFCVDASEALGDIGLSAGGTPGAWWLVGQGMMNEGWRSGEGDAGAVWGGCSGPVSPFSNPLSCCRPTSYPRSSFPLQSSMSMRAMEHSSGRMGRWSRVNQPPELSSSFCRCSSPLSYCAVKPTMRPFG